MENETKALSDGANRDGKQAKKDRLGVGGSHLGTDKVI